MFKFYKENSLYYVLAVLLIILYLLPPDFSLIFERMGTLVMRN